MVDFLWHDIRFASARHNGSFPHASFIQALIDSRVAFPIHKDTPWRVWTPRFEKEDTGKAPKSAYKKGKKEHASRLARFIAKTQNAIFAACTFNAREIANMERKYNKKVKGLRTISVLWGAVLVRIGILGL